MNTKTIISGLEVAIPLLVITLVTMFSVNLYKDNVKLLQKESDLVMQLKEKDAIIQYNANIADHWHSVADDLFSEWIYNKCGSHENANIYWDDMYFNCR